MTCTTLQEVNHLRFLLLQTQQLLCNSLSIAMWGTGRFVLKNLTSCLPLGCLTWGNCWLFSLLRLLSSLWLLLTQPYSHCFSILLSIPPSSFCFFPEECCKVLRMYTTGWAVVQNLLFEVIASVAVLLQECVMAGLHAITSIVNVALAFAC